MAEKESLPIISFCIPTYNSIDTVISAIKSIDVSYPSEIIVVDNESTDGTSLEVEHLSMENVRLIVKKTTRGEARNLAAENAVGKYVAMIDADVDYNGMENAIEAYLDVENHEKKLVLILPHESPNGNTPMIITTRELFLYLGGYPRLTGSEDKYLFAVAETLGMFKEIRMDIGFKPLILRGMTSGDERRYSRNRLDAIKRRLKINRDMIFVYRPGYRHFRDHLKLHGISGNIIGVSEYILGEIMAIFVSDETVKERVKRLRSRTMDS